MGASNTQLKNVLFNALKEAGALVLKYFNTSFEITSKDTTNNLVTEADQASERLITDIVRTHFPDHGIVGEEYGISHSTADYQWYIDPIDGTVNFAHKVPLCCVSIGVAYKGEMILGAVYNPMMNELFFAEKGQGAFLNDKKIEVSTKNDLAKAFLVTGFPYVFPEDINPLDIFGHFLKKELPIRRLGSAALDLCWVAAGRFDAFWENNLQSYDIAAGALIVKEAGGRVTNYSGMEISVDGSAILASNGHLHDRMLSEIQYVIQST